HPRWPPPPAAPPGARVPVPPPAAAPVAPPAVLARGLPVMALSPQAPAAAVFAGRATPLAMAPAPALALIAAQDKEASQDGGFSFAIISRDGSTEMTGSWGKGEWERLGALRNKIQSDFIWFKHEGRAYIVTDRATVEEAKGYFAPQEELGRQQAELGARQAELGAKQAELGRQQAAVAVEMPDLTREIRKIADQM